jgi:hypothetical protein
MNDEIFLKDVRATMRSRAERHFDDAAETPARRPDQETVIELLNGAPANDPAPPSSLHGQGNSVEARIGSPASASPSGAAAGSSNTSVTKTRQ